MEQPNSGYVSETNIFWTFLAFGPIMLLLFLLGAFFVEISPTNQLVTSIRG